MSTDWNWFFTSVSQSAAALVGIFGAFIITKILTNQTAFTAGNVKIQELIAEGKRLTDVSGRIYFNWYHNRLLENFIEKAEEELDKDSQQKPEVLFTKLTFSPYLLKEVGLAKIEEAKVQREKRIAKERQEAKEQRERAEAARNGPFSHLQPFVNSLAVEKSIKMPRFANEALRDSMSEERKRMDDMYTEAVHFIRVVSNLYASVSLNPESSPAITKSLRLVLLLFFIGVIYPLSFLPTPSDWTPAQSWNGLSDFLWSVKYAPDFILSLRGALLAFISGIFTYMVVMFLNMNDQMKYTPEVLRELEQYKSLATYSNFFANRAANDIAKAEERAKNQTKEKLSL